MAKITTDGLKKIEVLISFRHDGDSYFESERRFVTPQLEGYFCGLGWAKSIDGAVETGTPDTTPKKLEVQNGKHATKPSRVSSQSAEK